MELNAVTFSLAAAVGYLAGSISFARLVGRRVAPGEDLTVTEVDLDESESIAFRGVSASSLAFRSGPAAGCTVSVLDMVKAALPVVALRLLAPDSPLDLVAGAAAIAGHNYPVWHRFVGGRGLSPLFGVLAVVDWTAIPATMAASTVFGLLILADLFMSYASGPAFLIPWFWWRFGLGEEVVLAAAVNAIYWPAVMPELREWVGYRRRHPRPWIERIKDYRKGFARFVVSDDEPAG
jgi:glycerol-3-phosphate acyltransferase PlsY